MFEQTFDDVIVYIEADAQPGTPHYMRGHPDNWHPGEPGYCDIEGVEVDVESFICEYEEDLLEDYGEGAFLFENQYFKAEGKITDGKITVDKVWMHDWSRICRDTIIEDVERWAQEPW